MPLTALRYRVRHFCPRKFPPIEYVLRECYSHLLCQGFNWHENLQTRRLLSSANNLGVVACHVIQFFTPTQLVDGNSFFTIRKKSRNKIWLLAGGRGVYDFREGKRQLELNDLSKVDALNLI